MFSEPFGELYLGYKQHFTRARIASLFVNASAYQPSCQFAYLTQTRLHTIKIEIHI